MHNIIMVQNYVSLVDDALTRYLKPPKGFPRYNPKGQAFCQQATIPCLQPQGKCEYPRMQQMLMTKLSVSSCFFLASQDALEVM